MELYIGASVYPSGTSSICKIPFLKNLFCQISQIAYRPTKPSSLQDITTLYLCITTPFSSLSKRRDL